MTNRRGLTALAMALNMGHGKVEELLLEKVTKRQNRHQTCIRCHDSKVDVVLVPCGHQNLCYACARHVYRHAEVKKCLADGTLISDVYQLWEELGGTKTNSVFLHLNLFCVLSELRLNKQDLCQLQIQVSSFHICSNLQCMCITCFMNVHTASMTSLSRVYLNEMVLISGNSWG